MLRIKWNKRNQMIDIESTYLVVCGCIFTFLCNFFFSNYDCEAITKWGYGLLECVCAGNLQGFPRYVEEAFCAPTNYTLFVNTITAVWLSPVYIIFSYIGVNGSLLVYEVWYKILLGLVLAWDTKLFGDILQELEFEKKRRRIGCGMFLISSITLLAVLGKGQIDIYGLLFALLAVKFYWKSKYIKMSVLLGMAFLVKPLILWVILPFLLLLINKKKVKTVIYAVILFFPFLVDKVITILLMPEYIYFSKEVAQRMKDYFGGPSMFEQMFECKVNDVLIFWLLALVICFICYYLAVHGKVKQWHFLVFSPLLLILWGIFVCVSYQWFIYVLPFLIVMVLQYRKDSDGYLLMLGINGGLATYFAVAESMVILPTLSGNITGKVGELEAAVMQIAQSFRPYIFPAGKTLFFTAMLVVIGVFALERIFEKREISEEMQEGLSIMLYEKILLYLQPLPMVVYLLIAVLTGDWR